MITAEHRNNHKQTDDPIPVVTQNNVVVVAQKERKRKDEKDGKKKNHTMKERTPSFVLLLRRFGLLDRLRYGKEQRFTFRIVCIFLSHPSYVSVSYFCFLEIQFPIVRINELK